MIQGGYWKIKFGMLHNQKDSTCQAKLKGDRVIMMESGSRKPICMSVNKGKIFVTKASNQNQIG
jgi:hypothetical protein